MVFPVWGGIVARVTVGTADKIHRLITWSSQETLESRDGAVSLDLFKLLTRQKNLIHCNPEHVVIYQSMKKVTYERLDFI